MKNNIALIGFMGTGKNSIGNLLAKKLDKKFVDTDALIEKLAGKPISKIFEEDGENKFRELEADIIKKVAEMENVVTACGGGVVLNQTNVARLRKNSKIILLTASPKIILERVKNGKRVRPLLKGSNKLDKIKQLLSSREPLYKMSADYTIGTSKLSAEESVEKIIKLLR